MHARLGVFRPFLAAVAALLLAGRAGAEEAPPKTFQGQTVVTAVELAIEVRDAAGAVPNDLGPGDFDVREDGQPVTVLAVEPTTRVAVVASTPQLPQAPSPTGAPASWSTPERDGWRLVIWFDQTMASGRSIRRAATALAEQASRLTGLGRVEVVVAGDRPEWVLGATTSSPRVEQALLRVAREVPGLDRLRAIRRRFLDGLKLKGELDGRNQPAVIRDPQGPRQGGGEDEPATRGFASAARDIGAKFDREQLVRESVAEERMLLERRLDLLLGWATAQVDRGPRALLYVSDGWDLDPRDFYLAGAPSESTFFANVSAQLFGQETGAPTDQLARALAAGGWVAVAVASGVMEAGSTFGAEHTGVGRLGEIVVGAGDDDTISAFPTSMVARPLAPLDALADATGGEALTGVGRLPDAIQRLGERVRLVYQVPRSPDKKLRRLEVRALRPGLTVKAPRFAGDAEQASLAASRARGLLAGDRARGELPVVAALGRPVSADDGGEVEARLEARMELAPLGALLAAGAAERTVRVTLALELPDQRPFVHESLVDGQRLAGLAAWTYAAPLRLPAAGGRLAVVLEDVETGAWGGALANLVDGLPPLAVASAAEAAGAADERSDEEIILGLLPARRPLLLAAPAEEIVVGTLALEPLVVAPEVAKVTYLLDGREAFVATEPPFAGRLELGKLPLPHTIEAVATDATGADLGRDTLALNAGTAPLQVRLLAPGAAAVPGPVDVELAVSVPADGELDRVDLFWNDRRIASLLAPPFRHRMQLAEDEPTGYLAAVLHTKDGRSAEDVRLVGGGASGEAVDVRLVELWAVVTDAAGNPVRDLDPADLRLYDEGVERELAGVRDGGTLPLTLGLLVDSSASMAEELRAAQAAAIDFVQLGLSEQDRAFLVDFDSKPRLAHDLTGDKGELVRALGKLRADGYTALCDALVYGLARMQKLWGRRALVVVTDGIGREETVRFGACQRFVERSGVPVFMLLLPESGDDAARRTANAAERLERLLAAVAGGVLRVEDAAALPGAFRQVTTALRSQLLLTFYPRAGAGGDEGWRRVVVEARDPGLSVKSAGGYLQ